MILRLTAKSLKKIRTTEIDHEENQEKEKSLNEWYVNHFTLDRKGFFIITESKSLYSKIVPSAGSSKRKAFEVMIKNAFQEIENDHDFAKDKLSEEDMLICKTNNRSILGSQTDLIRMAKGIYYCHFEDADLSKINETPMSYTGSFPNKDIMEEIRKRKCF
ncbi:DUF6933 domain-containing protein [Alkalispirochaeta sphaeroplastigenens]|uniref:DUF6933 domain-containing protein n=1 Tax=Alkalispirochaeta sphaeroplastigenens TaxID=1187066 RepID=UPI0011AF7D9A|nr:hypothetical protein [Alkalispirochaeta sphaeroplastigenens]